MGFLFENIRTFIIYALIIGFAGLLISLFYNHAREKQLLDPRPRNYYKEGRDLTRSQKESIEFCQTGTAYLQSGNYDKALEEFDRAIYKDKYNYQAYLGGGTALYHKKKYDESTRYLKHSMRLNHKNIDALLLLANIYEHKNDYDRAINYNKKVLLLDSKNNTAKENLLRMRSKLSEHI